MSDGEAVGTAPRGPLRLLLLAAFFLTVGITTLEFLLSYLLRVYFSNAVYSPDLPALYNLLTGLVFFAFNPVICFLVFYKIGYTSDFEISSSYVGLLEYSFVGSIIGYSVGFVGTLGLEAIISNSSFGPQTNWLLFGGQLALELVRSGIDITLLAFAGVAVGVLRYRAKSKSVELEVQSTEQTSPV